MHELHLFLLAMRICDERARQTSSWLTYVCECAQFQLVSFAQAVAHLGVGLIKQLEIFYD